MKLLVRVNSLILLCGRLHPSGGFAGDRVFSWSTAKVLSALGKLRYDTKYTELPQRPAQMVGGVKTGPFILGFAVLLALAQHLPVHPRTAGSVRVFHRQCQP